MGKPILHGSSSKMKTMINFAVVGMVPSQGGRKTLRLFSVYSERPRTHAAHSLRGWCSRCGAIQMSERGDLINWSIDRLGAEDWL